MHWRASIARDLGVAVAEILRISGSPSRRSFIDRHSSFLARRAVDGHAPGDLTCRRPTPAVHSAAGLTAPMDIQAPRTAVSAVHWSSNESESREVTHAPSDARS